MKKILLISTTFYISIISSSQLSKGTQLFGGDLWGFYQRLELNSGAEYANKGFFISPMFGVATRQNFIQGAYVQIGFTDYQINSNSGQQNSNNLGVGYFLRKYSVIKNNFYGFLQVNGGVVHQRTTYEYPGSENSYRQTVIGVDLSPGLSYKLSKKLHLETGLRQIASISYQVSKNISINQNITETGRSKQVSIASSLDNFSSNLFFGFRLLLEKRTS